MRAAPVDLLEQLDALHARHDLVGDDDRDLLAVLLEIVDQLERLARVLGDRDVALVAEARRQLLAQRREDALLVVDADDVLAQVRQRRRAPTASIDGAPARQRRRRRPPAGPSIGSLHLEARAPGPAVDADRAAVLLDDARARCDRPRPVPSPLALVVKNGSKIRAATSGGMPGPCPGSPPPRRLFSTLVSIRDLAPPVHGLYRVVDEVGPHLVQLTDVRRNRRQRPE